MIWKLLDGSSPKESHSQVAESGAPLTDHPPRHRSHGPAEILRRDFTRIFASPLFPLSRLLSSPGGRRRTIFGKFYELLI